MINSLNYTNRMSYQPSFGHFPHNIFEKDKSYTAPSGQRISTYGSGIVSIDEGQEITVKDFDNRDAIVEFKIQGETYVGKISTTLADKYSPVEDA